MALTEIENLDKLLPEEARELSDLVQTFHRARNERNHALSDLYRHYIARWDKYLTPIQYGLWQPSFENGAHARYRAYRRVVKYKVVLYPFNRNEKGFEIGWEECAARILKSYIDNI